MVLSLPVVRILPAGRLVLAFRCLHVSLTVRTVPRVHQGLVVPFPHALLAVPWSHHIHLSRSRRELQVVL